MSNDYNKLVGKGVAGLGQNELKKRLKQHQALADKAKNKVGLEESMALMKNIDANKYVFPKDSNPRPGDDPNPLPGLKNYPELSLAIRQTSKGFKDAVVKTGKLAYNAYVTVDAINYGLLPGGVKPVNPYTTKTSPAKRARKAYKKLGD